MQGLKFRFHQLPTGSYHAVLHKQAFSDLILDGSFTLHISGDGLQESILGYHYEILYHSERSIESSLFEVATRCDVLIEFDQTPKDLKSVQIKPVSQGSMIQISPQWKKVQTKSDYPDPGTAVGAEQNGEPLWLSVLPCLADATLFKRLAPELGKIGPHLAFHWGRSRTDEEQLTDEAIYITNRCLSEEDPRQHGMLYPAVLVNAKDYRWVTVTMQQAHHYVSSEKAVPLAEIAKCMWYDEKVYYGVRVNFCGWTVSASGIVTGMKTQGPRISLLPGKLQLEPARNHLRLFFTWGGSTSSWFDLHHSQQFEM